jgi:peptidyl-prolyl cis-trans isomerase C
MPLGSGLLILLIGLATWVSGQALGSASSASASKAENVPGLSAQPVSPETVVISIGDLQVTAREVNRILETMPGQFRPFYSGPGKRQLADVIVNNKLLFKEAERLGLGEKDPVRLDLKISREAILTSAARNELQREVQVTEEAAQKYLNEHKEQFEEAKVRRIVICSASSLNLSPNQEKGNCLPDQEARAKAEEIQKKLVSGEDFEEMAAKFSNDSMTSGKGGDLGFIRRGHQVPLIVPPVEEAIFSIKVGTISEVIPSAFGFEIVKVEERRIPKLQDIRKELETQFRKQKVDELLKELKAQQSVKIDESFFAASPQSKGSTARRQ